MMSSLRNFWESTPNSYSKLEWFCIKVPLAIVAFKVSTICFESYQDVPIPAGICNFFPCSLLLGPVQIVILTILSAIFVLMYLLEYRMILATGSIFILLVFASTIEESNGILNRNGLLSFVFFAQFMAYYLAKHWGYKNLSYNRIQFSIQVVAIGYTLAGLSKLLLSGWHWVLDGKYMALQILKSYHVEFFDTADSSFLTKGQETAQYLIDNETLIILVLSFSLILELSAWIACFGKKQAFILGILLLCMHIGIKTQMNIFINTIAQPMIILFLNPLFLILFFAKKSWSFLQNRF